MAPRPFRALARWWRSPAVRFRTLLGLGAVAVFGVGLLVGAWFNVCGPVGACPSIAGLESYDPDQASRVYAADGRLVTDLGLERRTVVPLAQMSPAVIAAFLTTEDRRFYRHSGIDFIRVFGSLRPLLRGQRPHGFSTVTMQLAGNLWPEQINRRQRRGLAGVTRKLREARIAMEIERAYSKDKILELYLNQIDLGNRAFGVEAAAQRYFGKSARQLNVAEAALLAGLPKAPTRYNPRRNPDLAVQRRNLIIGLLRDAGKLAPESAEAWRAYPLALSSRSDYTGVADYYVEHVRQQLEARFGMELYRAGYRVYTHLDLDMQQAAERALAAQLERIEDGSTYGRFRHRTFREHLDARAEAEAPPDDSSPFSPYLQGAAVIIEARTGHVRAVVGGRDFGDSKWNRVTQALRQAGSTFKPFVYAAAIRTGIPLSRVYDDAPITVEIPDQEDWQPRNYDLKFRGPMSMREALYDSRNTIAVTVGLEVGVDAVVSEAANMGITTHIPRVPSIFIGSAEVTPLELTSAFGTFANMGVRVQPSAILRVEDRHGNIVWQPEVRATRVMDQEHAWLVLDALRDVVRRGTAAGAVAGRGFTLPAGGKTGTTNDGMDVWYVGFTPDLVAGVWIGFDRKQTIMANAQGGRLAAPAWTDMMKEVYERRAAPAAWPMPPGLIALEIDGPSGYLAGPLCPREAVRVEFFYPGTEPTERCPGPRRADPAGSPGTP
jgi:penicillin-binding protein 1A